MLSFAHDNVGYMFLQSATSDLLIFVFCIFLLLAVYKASKLMGFSWKAINSRLLPLAIIVWSLGFISYVIGGMTEPGWPPLSVIPMSAIHATEMFVGASDISAIHEHQHNSWQFMCLFGVSHLLAVIISSVFILKHLGYSVWSKIILFIRGFIGSNEDLFVFWGMNDKTYQLAKDIIKTQKKAKSARVVVVRTFDEDNESSRQIGIGRILNSISMSNKELKEMQDLDCLSADTFHRLSTLDLPKNDNKFPIINNMLRLSSLHRIIKNTSGKIHILFLADDEDVNINCAINIIRDSALDEKDTCFYVHACHGVKTEWMEYYGITSQKPNSEIKIIDSSQLAVNMLKSKVEYQPVSFVNINNDSTVTDAFNSMIIGCGETGKEVLKYLYEFAAFEDGKGNRSPFLCEVIDKEIKHSCGRFFAQNAALKQHRSNDESAVIRLNELDTMSDTFWEMMNEKIEHLNYIVITINNDKNAMELASDIYRLALKKRTEDSMKHFGIFVRSNNTEDELRYNKIEELYNKYIDNESYGIVVFGSIKDIFTYDLIIDESTVKHAKHFLNSYNSVTNKNDKNWTERRKSCLKGKGEDYFNMINLKRKETQDIANANHVQTKLRLFEASLIPGMTWSGCRHLLQNLTHSGEMTKATDRSNVKYDAPEENITIVDFNTVMTNLAKTEHHRWTASHEMLGYVEDENTVESNSKAMTHNCMLPWEKLEAMSQKAWEASYGTDYKLCDYQVVETSFKI